MSLALLIQRLAWSAGSFRFESEGTDGQSIRIYLEHGDIKVQKTISGDKLAANGEAEIERVLMQAIEFVEGHEPEFKPRAMPGANSPDRPQLF